MSTLLAVLVDGIIYRFRTGCPWRDVPEWYEPWRAIWRRHSQLSSRGVWDQVLVRLLTQADAAGEVAVDAKGHAIDRHEHAGGPRRHRDPAVD